MENRFTDGLDLADFNQPITIKELQESNCSFVPRDRGVYIVLRSSKAPPIFLRKSTGGWFKGKDPSYALEVVKSNWVKNATILYIGKAAGKNGLRQRMRQYVQFGQGKAVGHRGGRLIWHLKDNKRLLLRYLKLQKKDPNDFETVLINEFKKVHEVRPFANLNK